MSDGRLAAHIEISGLIRRAGAVGGHAAILRKGDREAGAILILLAERGTYTGLLERAPSLAGLRWRLSSVEEIERKQSINEYLVRRGERDSDLWVIELDIPQAERFAAEMATTG